MLYLCAQFDAEKVEFLMLSMQNSTLLNQHIISEITSCRYGRWKTHTSKCLHGQLPNVNPKIHSRKGHMFIQILSWCAEGEYQFRHAHSNANANQTFYEMSQRIWLKWKTHTRTYIVQFMIEKHRKMLFCTRLWLIHTDFQAITNRIKNGWFAAKS